MFGATFYMPRATMVHDGSAGYAVGEVTSHVAGITAGGQTLDSYAFNSTSKADVYAVPTVAVTQDLSGLGIPVVLGVGVSATSGIGVDYKHTSNSLGAAAELINLGVNAGIGMKMSDTLDVGVSMTITYAMLEAGLTGSGGMTHDIGFRGTFGARKQISDATTIGVYYNTEQRHEYDNLHVTSNHYSHALNGISFVSGIPIQCNGDNGAVCRQDVIVEQPWNVGLGIAHDLDANTKVMLDVTHKKWSDAKFFDEFYDDQNVVSIGIQKTMGNLKLRAGYGYADDPLLSRVNVGQNIKTIGGVNVGGQSYTAPMYGLFMSYFQAMETPVIYKHRIAVGLGVENFLGVPFLSLDTHAAVQLEEDKCFGSGQDGLTTSDGFYHNGTSGSSLGHTLGLTKTEIAGCVNADHTKATVSSFHLGGALTWSF